MKTIYFLLLVIASVQSLREITVLYDEDTNMIKYNNDIYIKLQQIPQPLSMLEDVTNNKSNYLGLEEFWFNILIIVCISLSLSLFSFYLSKWNNVWPYNWLSINR